jgi:hypothetical protein
MIGQRLVLEGGDEVFGDPLVSGSAAKAKLGVRHLLRVVAVAPRSRRRTHSA